jgi:hypothetical protein
MKFIYSTGQTCNKFWAWSRYFADGLANNEKIFVIIPDITIEDYPNMLNSSILKFPLYSKLFMKLLKYRIVNICTNYIFTNKFIVYFIGVLLRYVNNSEYIITTTGGINTPNKFRYFDDIKMLFKPNDSIETYCRVRFNEYKTTNTVYIGLHIRYGDYRNFLNGKYFYDLSVYKNKLTEIINQFVDKQVVVFIASNEKLDLAIFDDVSYFSFEESTPTMDLYGLMLCDYILGPPSTYSAWASYLGENSIFFIENADSPIEISNFKNISILWDGL